MLTQLTTSSWFWISFCAFLSLWLSRQSLLRRGGPRRRLFGADLQGVERMTGGTAALLLFALVNRGRPPWPDVFGGGAEVLGIGALVRLLDLAVAAQFLLRGKKGAPRIVRSLITRLATVAAAAVVLHSRFHVEVQSLFATSALLSVVLGFALQETLGNLFSGLSLNAERPFEQGEWVSFGSRAGRVLDVGWRSTRLLTPDDDELVIPNAQLSKEMLINHSRPFAHDNLTVQLRLDQEAAPPRVKETLLRALRACPMVLAEPAPVAEMAGFDDHGALYRVRFFTEGFQVRNAALDQVHQSIWYALRREGLEMPHPQQTLSQRELPEEAEARRQRQHLVEAESLLGGIDFVAALSEAVRRELAASSRYLEFGPGEAVVREGESGDTLYLVARGELSVRVKVQGNGEREVARLSRGQFFGEMSLLTGEPRTATVLATLPSDLIEVPRAAFSRVLAAEPELAHRLAHAIVGRRAALDSARSEGAAALQREEDNLFSRICTIFGYRRERVAI